MCAKDGIEGRKGGGVVMDADRVAGRMIEKYLL